MKTFLLSVLVCLAACACSRTIAKNAAGATILDTQANASHILVTDGSFHLEMWDVDHSTPTLAGGQAFALGLDSGGRFVTNAGLAFGSSGLSKAAGGSAAPRTMFNRPSAVAPPLTRTR